VETGIAETDAEFLDLLKESEISVCNVCADRPASGYTLPLASEAAWLPESCFGVVAAF
jgi:hypothetical protein